VLGASELETLPHPQADLNGFVDGLKRALAATPAVWDPLRNRERVWLDAEKIRVVGRRERRRELWANGAGVSAGCNCVVS